MHDMNERIETLEISADQIKDPCMRGDVLLKEASNARREREKERENASYWGSMHEEK